MNTIDTINLFSRLHAQRIWDNVILSEGSIVGDVQMVPPEDVLGAFSLNSPIPGCIKEVTGSTECNNDAILRFQVSYSLIVKHQENEEKFKMLLQWIYTYMKTALTQSGALTPTSKVELGFPGPMGQLGEKFTYFIACHDRAAYETRVYVRNIDMRERSALVEALTWAKEMLLARDQMNAKVHCAPLRLSPITERCMEALNNVSKIGSHNS